jgi:hypothetical protein
MNELIIDQQSAAALLIDCGTVDTCSWTPPPNMTFQQWAEIGRKFQQVDTSINWWLGDWLNEGEKRYGETFAQAIEVTGHKLDQLQQCKYVSASVKKTNRLVFLSWTHHLHVVSLPDEEQRSLLATALENEWSSRELNEVVKSYRDTPPRIKQEKEPPTPAPDLTYRASDTRDLATIAAAMDTVQRARWLTTVGVTDLPPIMRPFEHSALGTYANVTADLSKWLVGDHGLQVEREIDHLARLYKWAPEKRQANLSAKLSDAAAQHRMALDEFERHMETARMFGADMRRQSATVGYEHHFILRNRSRAEAVEYLDRAERKGWTVQRLDEELHPHEQANANDVARILLEVNTVFVDGNMLTVDSRYGKLIITQWRIE